jgi:hypothetical protein
MESLTSRLGTRFLVVTVVPNILLLGYLGFLLAAGAPARSPSLTRAAAVLDGLSTRQIIVLALAVLVFSVATHPLQTPLIQLVEGYWQGLPFGSAAADTLTARFREELRRAKEGPGGGGLSGSAGPQDSPAQQGPARRHSVPARRPPDWLPPRERDLLPTVLGNTLRVGEGRAGDRYGLDLEWAWPRLSPLLSKSSLADLRDRRNQLDSAVRLCIVAGLATAIGIFLLIRHGSWLFLPVGTYALCWACYRAAVNAAKGFSKSLAAAVDLHHLKLFDALQMERPADLADEYNLNTRTLKFLFRSGIRYEDKGKLHYLPLKTDKPSGEEPE